MARIGLDIELCTKCAIFLLHCHHLQIIHTQSLLDDMLALQEILCGYVSDYKSLIGVNNAGLRYLQRTMEQRKEDILSFQAIQIPATQITANTSTITKANDNKNNNNNNNNKSNKKMKLNKNNDSNDRNNKDKRIKL
eukprot:gene18291-25738_t